MSDVEQANRNIQRTLTWSTDAPSESAKGWNIASIVRNQETDTLFSVNQEKRSPAQEEKSVCLLALVNQSRPKSVKFHDADDHHHHGNSR